MGYYIDLEKLTLENYKEKLRFAYLPPSRIILKENLGHRFGIFKIYGIENVKQLLSLLKNKKILLKLTRLEDFSEDYLKILLREINSLRPKPNKFSEFKGISNDTISKLEKMGIKNTEKLYDLVLTEADRLHLAATSGINYEVILELTKLTDLSRIKWVGATFARMLLDMGVDTLEKAVDANPIELHLQIKKYNMDNQVFKGNIGLNDIKIFVNSAKDIPGEIEYSDNDTKS